MDYNKLRKMLGLPQKILENNQYIFQVKHRILDELTSELVKKILLLETTFYDFQKFAPMTLNRMDIMALII